MSDLIFICGSVNRKLFGKKSGIGDNCNRIYDITGRLAVGEDDMRKI